MATSAFARRLADTAAKQYEKYHLMREQEAPLAAQIREYWRGIAAFPGVTVPWSAVFVSWCVRQAGATATEFRFASAHSRFVHRAIQNFDRGVGVFHGRTPADYAPKVGDILQNNRGRHGYDYGYARTHENYESHSAIVIEVGYDTKGRYLRTVGGNESDSVGLKEVRLSTKGMVKNDGGLYIAVVEALL